LPKGVFIRKEKAELLLRNKNAEFKMKMLVKFKNGHSQFKLDTKHQRSYSMKIRGNHEYI
jgi:hypothetical protein